MNKRQAVYLIANHVAGLLETGDLEEASGLADHMISEADWPRLAEALQEVADRLRRMGQAGD